MLNVVNVVGRITAAPEVKFIGSENTPCVNFGIAVNRPYKDKVSGEYEADFFNVSAFGRTAEFIGSYVQKGNLLAVKGTLTTRTYEKELDGKKQTHYVVEIKADNVYNYSPKSDGEVPVKKGNVNESPADVKAAMNKEFAQKSVGLDKEAKDNLKKEIAKKYQARLDAAGKDLPF